MPKNYLSPENEIARRMIGYFNMTGARSFRAIRSISRDHRLQRLSTLLFITEKGHEWMSQLLLEPRESCVIYS